jgi:hypothetical protein
MRDAIIPSTLFLPVPCFQLDPPSSPRIVLFSRSRSRVMSSHATSPATPASSSSPSSSTLATSDSSTLSASSDKSSAPRPSVPVSAPYASDAAAAAAAATPAGKQKKSARTRLRGPTYHTDYQAVQQHMKKIEDGCGHIMAQTLGGLSGEQVTATRPRTQKTHDYIVTHLADMLPEWIDYVQTHRTNISRASLQTLDATLQQVCERVTTQAACCAHVYVHVHVHVHVSMCPCPGVHSCVCSVVVASADSSQSSSRPDTRPTSTSNSARTP